MRVYEVDWLVEGRDAPLGRDGPEAQHDVDAEEHGDAVEAVGRVRRQALL